MDKKDFIQGMSHEKAIKYNLGIEGLNGEDAIAKTISHIRGLKSRPDYDGIVTISEGVQWAKNHPNLDADNNPGNGFENATPDDYLYVDASKLDFGRLSTSNFALENKITPINLFKLAGASFTNPTSASLSTTYHLGRVDMRLLDRSTGSVEVVNNSATAYDWNKGGSSIRKWFITMERARTGLNDSHGVPTYIYGIGKIRTKAHQLRGASSYKYWR